jgi:hypothetical protein
MPSFSLPLRSESGRSVWTLREFSFPIWRMLVNLFGVRMPDTPPYPLNSQQVPMEIFDGNLLDGRRRWMACERAGVEPKLKNVCLGDPVAYVVWRSSNQATSSSPNSASSADASLTSPPPIALPGNILGRCAELFGVRLAWWPIFSRC